MIWQALSWVLGWVWWCVLPIRKRLAIDNYHRAFPDRVAGDLRRTVGGVAVGYLQLFLGIRSQVEGEEHVRLPCLCLAGHGASWDMTVISWAARVPVTIFVKPPANALVRRLITHLRTQVDLELLPPTNSMAAAYDALERGRVVVFVQDQRHNQGIPVSFFGRSARTSPGFASMLWRTRAPVVGVWQWVERGRHRTRMVPLDWEIPEDRDEAVTALTARSQQYYESCIRSAPWSWWWLHDRWKGGEGAGESTEH